VQARALAGAAASVAEDDAIPELLDRLRALLGLDAVAVSTGGVVEVVAGDPAALASDHTGRVELDEGHVLVTAPPVEEPDELGIVRAFGSQLVAAMRRNELASAERAARALGEIDRFRTALLRSVSHDLRSPLASIKAAASSLQQDDVDWPADARAEFVSTIIEEGDRLDRIVTNLLDASRLEAGVLAVDQRPVHLDDVVHEVVSNLPDDQFVTVGVGDDTPAVLADPALLERVLDNVVTNAVRHAGAPVEVDTVIDHAAGIVHLRVVDHGLGLPPAARTTMFDEFQHLGDHGAGVGLGLAVAHGFVEAMGGALEPSDTPGGGLTMSIILPIAEFET
jgi:two-component system sensor histidine kinase KdpD